MASAIEELVLQSGPEDGKDTYVRSSTSNGGDRGLNNDELPVGGWSDWYYSFIKFDFTGLNSISSATV